MSFSDDISSSDEFFSFSCSDEDADGDVVVMSTRGLADDEADEVARRLAAMRKAAAANLAEQLQHDLDACHDECALLRKQVAEKELAVVAAVAASDEQKARADMLAEEVKRQLAASAARIEAHEAREAELEAALEAARVGQGGDVARDGPQTEDAGRALRKAVEAATEARGRVSELEAALSETQSALKDTKGKLLHTQDLLKALQRQQLETSEEQEGSFRALMEENDHLKEQLEQCRMRERMQKSNAHAAISAMEKKHAVQLQEIREAGDQALEAEVRVLEDAHQETVQALQTQIDALTSQLADMQVTASLGAVGGISDILGGDDVEDTAEAAGDSGGLGGGGVGEAAAGMGHDDGDGDGDGDDDDDGDALSLASLTAAANVLAGLSDDDDADADDGDDAEKRHEALQDRAHKAELEAQLGALNKQLAKQLKVLDGVNMVRKSFAEGSAERARSDVQYQVLVEEASQLEARRWALEKTLLLPASPAMNFAERKVRRARADTILQSVGSPDGSPSGPGGRRRHRRRHRHRHEETSAVLESMSQEQLLERMQKLDTRLEKKHRELEGLRSFLEPSNKVQFPVGSEPHKNIIRSINECEQEMADMRDLRDKVIGKLEMTPEQLVRLKQETRLEQLRGLIAKQEKIRDGMRQFQVGEFAYPESSEERADVDRKAAACETELRKLQAEADAITHSLEDMYEIGDEDVIRTAVARYDFAPSADGELAFQEGAVLCVCEEFPDGWSRGFVCDHPDSRNPLSAMGLFPSEYLSPS